MKILLLCTFFALDTLPPESQLMAALDSFYQLQIESELAELDVKQKKKWLKYLPTVGVTYTLDGEPRPAISWSSTLLYSSQKDKAQVLAKKQSIYKKNQLALEKDKLKLKSLLRKHHSLEQDISFLQDLFKYDQQLFEIKKDQANKIQLAPSDFLKAEQALKKKAYDIFQKQRELLELKTQILITAKYFNYYDSIEN